MSDLLLMAGRRVLLSATVLAGICLAQGPTPEQQAATAARSVHLTYRREAFPATVFYGEATVSETYPGTYFCITAFDGGYGGIQTLSDGSHAVIFSVWDKGNEEVDAATVRRTRPDYAGLGVEIARFGGEGTGGRAMAPWPWEVGKKVRFAVSMRPEGDGLSSYTGWIWEDARGEWFRIATFASRVNGNEGRLRGCYSFVEDFLRNGESRRHARQAAFGMLWAYGEKGWGRATGGTFSGDSNALKTIDAGIAPGAVWLRTGADTLQRTALGATLTPGAAEDDSTPHRAKLLEAIAAASPSPADALDFAGRRLSPWAGHKAGVPERVGDVVVRRWLSADGRTARFVLEATGDKPIETGPMAALRDVPEAELTGSAQGALLRSGEWLFGIGHPDARLWVGDHAEPVARAPWSPADCKAGLMTLPIGKVAAGERLRVTFRYRRGRDRLNLRAARLLDASGKTCAEDVHDGLAGCDHRGNVYTLRAPEALAAPTLLLAFDNRDRAHSFGEVTVERLSPGYGFGGFPKGLTLKPGEPVAFAVGALAVEREMPALADAFALDGLRPRPWDKGHATETLGGVRLTRDVRMLPSGGQRATFTLEPAGDEPVAVGEVVFVRALSGCVAGPKALRAKGGCLSANAAAAAALLSPVAAMWTPETFKGAAQTLPVRNVRKGETWLVDFAYASGWCALRVVLADLVDGDDKVVARDEHDVVAGTARKGAPYRLAAPKDIPEGWLFMRFDLTHGYSGEGLIMARPEGPGIGTLSAPVRRVLRPGERVTLSLTWSAT